MEENQNEHEALVEALRDSELRTQYESQFLGYRPGIVPRVFAGLLMGFGDLFYGSRPSYRKFRALEIVARIPYQSWEVASYTILSAFCGNERFAIRLCRLAAFARFAQDNETMHVVVISQILRRQKRTGFIRFTLIPVVFSIFYFWAVYLLYMFSHKAALELNYLFESHAYKQYSEFLEKRAEHLKEQPVMSDFLDFYGRQAKSEYELFESIRNDELIHRNRSIREIEALRA